jgi:hypothetical protein
MTPNEFSLKLDSFELGYITSILTAYDDATIPTNQVVRNILKKIGEITKEFK